MFKVKLNVPARIMIEPYPDPGIAFSCSLPPSYFKYPPGAAGICSDYHSTGFAYRCLFSNSSTCPPEPPAARFNDGIRWQLQTKSLGPSVDCAGTPAGPPRYMAGGSTAANAASTTTETGWFFFQHAASLEVPDDRGSKKKRGG